MRKSKIDSVLIRNLVDRGLTDQDIATRMGWTVGTLRVTCSRQKISLRRYTKGRTRPRLTANIVLPRGILEQMRQRATSMGLSPTELAADLLREVVRHDLFDAVLDIPKASRARSAQLHAGIKKGPLAFNTPRK